MDNLLFYNKWASLNENMKLEVISFIDLLIKNSNTNFPINKPKFGSAKGTFCIKPDFDQPLVDFMDYS